MAGAASSFDLIIDTVPVKHDVNPYLPLLDVDGTLVLVGQIGPLAEPSTVPLLMGRRRIAGSPIGAALPRRRKCWTSAPRRASCRVAR